MAKSATPEVAEDLMTRASQLVSDRHMHQARSTLGLSPDSIDDPSDEDVMNALADWRSASEDMANTTTEDLRKLENCARVFSTSKKEVLRDYLTIRIRMVRGIVKFLSGHLDEAFEDIDSTVRYFDRELQLETDQDQRRVTEQARYVYSGCLHLIEGARAASIGGHRGSGPGVRQRST
ncbi:MAG: hypothetical protein ACXWB2_08380 [Acidimicrobiales bacterium]